MEKLVFFLGGHDLEMIAIRELLVDEAAGRFFDKGLGWGARSSGYREEIMNCLAQGKTPVLIELEEDLGLEEDSFILVDHHGSRAGVDKPTSLHQVFELLKLPREKWTRRHTLIAANDRGYIPELIAAGAGPEEIKQIRAADRRAQGIKSEEEESAEESLGKIETRVGGGLSIVYLSHTRTAAVTDRLDPALGGPGYKNLVIISPNAVNVYGTGSLIHALSERFPGGYYGGALPERGYWGISRPDPEIVPFIEKTCRV